MKTKKKPVVIKSVRQNFHIFPAIYKIVLFVFIFVYNLLIILIIIFFIISFHILCFIKNNIFFFNYFVFCFFFIIISHYFFKDKSLLNETAYFNLKQFYLTNTFSIIF